MWGGGDRREDVMTAVTQHESDACLKPGLTVAQAGETVKRIGLLALTFAPVPTILSVSSSSGIGDGRAKEGICGGMSSQSVRE